MSTKSTKKSKEIELSFADELRSLFGLDYYSHKPLREHVFSGTGGAVDHLVVANSTSNLLVAAKLAVKHRVPYVVIGSGSGILMSDYGFAGLVIINMTSQILFAEYCSQVIVDSGVGTARLVNTAAARRLGGMEFLAAVPGTVGGAVATNASWDGKSISALIKELVVFIPKADGGEVVTVPSSELSKRPYQPIFQQTSYPPVILTLKLQLSSLAEEEILRRLFRIRKQRKNIGVKSLGSIFTQPLQEVLLDKTIVRQLPSGLRLQKNDSDIIVIDPVKVTAQHIQAYISLMEQYLTEKGIQFERRLRYLGQWSDRGEHEEEL
jgi:UDP-N-acetylmuramate dehydrogenase